MSILFCATASDHRNADATSSRTASSIRITRSSSVREPHSTYSSTVRDNDATATRASACSACRRAISRSRRTTVSIDMGQP